MAKGGRAKSKSKPRKRVYKKKTQKKIYKKKSTNRRRPGPKRRYTKKRTYRKRSKYGRSYRSVDPNRFLMSGPMFQHEIDRLNFLDFRKMSMMGRGVQMGLAAQAAPFQQDQYGLPNVIPPEPEEQRQGRARDVFDDLGEDDEQPFVVPRLE